MATTTSVVQKHGSFIRQGKMAENRAFDYIYGLLLLFKINPKCKIQQFNFL